MQATAINLGNGKEKILVDGKVYIQAAATGKYNYISRVFKENSEHGYSFESIGKHRTKSAAEKFGGTFSKGAKIVRREVAEVVRQD